MLGLSGKKESSNDKPKVLLIGRLTTPLGAPRDHPSQGGGELRSGSGGGGGQGERMRSCGTHGSYRTVLC